MGETQSVAPGTPQQVVAPREQGERAKPLELGYVPAMDGLRAFGVLIVIGLHIGFVIRPSGSYLPGGFIGVDVFFVLSGFLITALLLSEQRRAGSISIKDFYLRRACRLLPAIWLMLGLHAAYWMWSGKPFGIEARAVMAIGFYVSNIYQSFPGVFPVRMPTELTHTWSLSLEEQFYLVWPGLLILILRFHRSARRSIPTALVVGLIASTITRVLVFRTQGYPAGYELLWTHADGLCMGCGLAFLWRDGKLPTRGIVPLAWISLASLVAWSCLYSSSWGDVVYYAGFTYVGLASSVLLVAVLNTNWSASRLFASKPLVAIGKTSYGAYLYHLPLIEITRTEMAGQPTALIVFVALGATAATTALSWHFVERPFLRLKARRFGGRDEGRAATQPVPGGPRPAIAAEPAS